MADRGFRGRPTRSERADRRINEGHSRGLEVALSKVEASIKNRKTEKGYILDSNGKIISETSGKGKTSKAAFRNGNYENGVLTHNHPKEINNRKGFGGMVGDTFSDADIYMGIKRNLKEIRAVTNGYTYSLKRPKKGWGISNTDLERTFFVHGKGKKQTSGMRNELTRRFNNYFLKSSESNKKKLTDTYKGKISSLEDLNANVLTPHKKYTEELVGREAILQHQLIREYSKKYGWNYTRKKTS